MAVAALLLKLAHSFLQQHDPVALLHQLLLLPYHQLVLPKQLLRVSLHLGLDYAQLLVNHCAVVVLGQCPLFLLLLLALPFPLLLVLLLHESQVLELTAPFSAPLLKRRGLDPLWVLNGQAAVLNRPFLVLVPAFGLKGPVLDGRWLEVVKLRDVLLG